MDRSFAERPAASSRRGGTICVFCGSHSGNSPVYAAAAARFGGDLASRGITLVYGGARGGLMGALADAALRAGGQVIGVMPEHLIQREIAHPGLSKLHIVGTMHERKALMADLSDAFVLLPGGFGSWDEFCEVVTWAQLGLHHKPCGILNVENYYAPFRSMAEHAVNQGFVQAVHRDMIIVEDDAESLLARLALPHDTPPHRFSQ